MINSGDTAWVLASGALVLFMTPGLAIFYGGMVRAKSALNMMMMSFAAIGITTIIWVLYGYSLTFGTSHNGLIGGFEHLGLAKTLDSTIGAEGHQIPTLAFAMFQLTFAIITVALLSGAIADRTKYSSWACSGLVGLALTQEAHYLQVPLLQLPWSTPRLHLLQRQCRGPFMKSAVMEKQQRLALHLVLSQAPLLLHLPADLLILWAH